MLAMNKYTMTRDWEWITLGMDMGYGAGYEIDDGDSAECYNCRKLIRSEDITLRLDTHGSCEWEDNTYLCRDCGEKHILYEVETLSSQLKSLLKARGRGGK